MEKIGFDNLDLSPQVQAGIDTMGFTTPTEVQKRTIPTLLTGRDVMAQAKTGTGKTLAFAIPILERVVPEINRVQALIIAPTRELSIQIEEEIKRLSVHTPVRSLCVYGGASIGPQIKTLERGVQVVVGTPGRMLDHIQRRTLDLSQVSTVVLDEADRMLDMGFIRDIERILRHTPKDRQTLLFSATLPDAICRLAQRYLRDPENITVSTDDLTVDSIEQRYLEVARDKKLSTFIRLLRKEHPDSAIIFCATKRWAHKLAAILKDRGFRAAAIHGDLTQANREAVLRKFRQEKTTYLVATDVAARGLDITHVSHVFNYDLPQEAKMYVHRIGRTGRLGREGKAFTFIEPHNIRALWEIEHVCRTKIKPHEESAQAA